jgi:hypothetical protein
MSKYKLYCASWPGVAPRKYAADHCVSELSISAIEQPRLKRMVLVRT